MPPRAVSRYFSTPYRRTNERTVLEKLYRVAEKHRPPRLRYDILSEHRDDVHGRTLAVPTRTPLMELSKPYHEHQTVQEDTWRRDLRPGTRAEALEGRRDVGDQLGKLLGAWRREGAWCLASPSSSLQNAVN